ncbi:uncharacterized protein K02A2.6-like isoform X2 [Leguminivora glycinivorella]|nr:uncharacterized protein K02A2.6-like isoform X2 [Leguminivora glycinivorella]
MARSGAMALTLDKFECGGEPTSLGARWERWKRALLIYIDAAGIEKNEKKRASLLHFGGQELQEIFYNIPDPETEDGVPRKDVFQIALSKLDSYFSPKQSKVYERHLFRQVKQEINEKFEKFLVRLRQQADKCQFHNKDEHIIDQIIEKGSSSELRKKILRAGDDMTLEKIIYEANSLEAVNRQLEDFAEKSTNKEEVNKISTKQNSNYVKKFKEPCQRCGSRSHLKCPAIDKECFKCKRIGHFQQMCRKRKLAEDRNSSNKKFKSNREPHQGVNQMTSQIEEVQYVFNIDSDDTIDCEVGGFNISMLIDSGSKWNLIGKETWTEMIRNNVVIYDQNKDLHKTFVPYGSTTALSLQGTFKANIKVGSQTQDATFYVITEGTRNLLGRDTAKQLGVLKLGLDINQIQEETFPKIKNVLIHIPIDETIQPVSQPLRRIPIPLEKKVEEKLQDLIKRDIIEEVSGSSKWVSPIVPILKENGELRLCVDMRRANAAIMRENHPLPTMDKLLPQVRDAKYFSKLDIRDAFHQLELHPDSRHITTFITSLGMYRYKRLMFGITCAPEIFQKTIEKLLLGCEGVINFMDDILVYGRDKEEHDTRLQQVTNVLKENNVVLKEEKCIIGVTKVHFLGHELSAEGVRPLQKYLSAIQQFRSPKTVGELQSFMGLVNYVGRWIPNLSTLTEPMKLLLRNRPGKNTVLQNDWGCKQQSAFQALKEAISNIPTLGYYDVSKKTVVIADASPVGLGAVLVQIHDNEPRIIAFGSRTLTDCERRYCQTEKEALALVWAIEHFHIFLYGKQFDLITDHKPLEVIFGPKSKPCARIERWILRLQSYKFKVIYRPGKNNIADPLSRLNDNNLSSGEPIEHHIQQIVEYIRPRAISLNEVAYYSEKDPEIQKVKAGLYHNNWDEEVKIYKLFQTELCFYEEILLRGTRIVIPKDLRKIILTAAHEGHPGIVAMKARLRAKVWWPKYDREAEKLVKSCAGCTLVSAPNPPNPLKRRELPDEAWKDVAIDLLGPLPSGDHIFVIIDYFSRYKEVKICRKIDSTEMTKHLLEIFSRLGDPATITADNGRQFISDHFKSFCKERGITLHSTIPYWPQMNGEVERQNKDILKRLRISQVEKKDWKLALIEYIGMYNSTPHSVTGKTPAELFFRRQFRDKIPMVSDLSRKGDFNLENKDVDMEVRDKDKELKEKGKEYTDEKRKAKECTLVEGDKVVMKNITKENKLSTPFGATTLTVEKVNGGDVEVVNDETGQRYRRNVVHLKRVDGEWQINLVVDY